MLKENSLNSKIIRVFGTNFFASLAGISLIIILSRLLSVEEFGRLNFIISLIMIMYTIYDFGFVNSSVIFINKNNENKNENIKNINYLFHNYAKSIFIINIILNLSVSLIFKLNSLEQLLLGIGSFSLFVVKYMQALFQSLGEWDDYNKISLINNSMKLLVVSCGTLSFLSYNTYDMSLIFYCIYFTLLIMVIGFFSKNLFLRKNQSIAKAKSSEILSITWPIGVQNIILIILMRSDLILINTFLSAKELGIYSAANQLALIFPLLTTAISTVFLKEASSITKHKFLKQVFKTQKILFFPSLIIISFSVFFHSEIIEILFGEKYISSSLIFLQLLTINILSVFFSGIESFVFVHKQKTFLIIKIFQLMVFFASNFMLINILGLYSIIVSIALYKILGWIICNFIVIKNYKAGNENVY